MNPLEVTCLVYDLLSTVVDRFLFFLFLLLLLWSVNPNNSISEFGIVSLSSNLA
jgi:hypothetical protein